MSGDQMAIWFNYSPVTPMIEKYVDDGSRDLCTARVKIGDAAEFEVSLVGRETEIELIRVATLNSDGNLTPVQQETVGKLIDHMLAVLRFTYRAEVDLIRFGENTISFGTHDTNGKPNLSLSMSEILNQNFRVNGDNIRNTFAASLQIRPLMKLLSDTQNNALPLQYRYLSLYKAFEHEFRVGKKWPGLKDLFARYEDRYQSLNLGGRRMDTIFHSLRDKCAHIKIGSAGDLGIVGLDGKDAADVALVLPLFKEIICAHMSEKFKPLQFVPPTQLVSPVAEENREA